MTGYTSALLANEAMTFEQFVMLCARAMGACITMRDDPFDAVIPEAFEPSPYYAEQLRAKQELVAKLKAMTKDEAVAHAEGVLNTRIASLEKRIEEIRKNNARLRDMIARVTQWNPPTEEHDGLQRFMLEQLEMSLESDEWERQQITDLACMDAWKFHVMSVGEAVSDMVSLAKHQAEEVARVASRNAWLSKLRSSLKG